MPVRSCRVTIPDMDGVSHTVEVAAASLYEAVAEGLAALRGKEWGSRNSARGQRQGSDNRRSSRTRSQTVGLHEWLDRPGGVSPREVSERQ